MASKLFTTIIVVERQFTPSLWLHSNMGLLPGVIVPAFIEFTVTVILTFQYRHVGKRQTGGRKGKYINKY